MNVDQRPDLGLQQHLHLTTELKQGIAILRMSAQELSEYARKCVEENPFFDDDDWVEPRHPLAPERYSQDVSADALFEKRGHGSPETFDAERSDLSQRSFSFDRFLADFIPGMREGDLLMVTADHGCDPSYTKTTDHTREYVPYLVCGKGVKPGVDLGTKLCFGTIAQTICEYLGVDASSLDGHSVWNEIKA